VTPRNAAAGTPRSVGATVVVVVVAFGRLVVLAAVGEVVGRDTVVDVVTMVLVVVDVGATTARVDRAWPHPANTKMRMSDQEPCRLIQVP
jgi:hypothetical protein